MVACSRRGNILLRSHGAERGARGCRVGDAEADLVKDVQTVDAYLQADRFVNRDLLDERRVGGVVCRRADSGEGRREGDQVVGKLLRRDAVEYVDVEPLCRGAVGTAERDILRVAGQQHIAKDDGRTALVGVDVGEVPIADEDAGNALDAGQQRASLADGQR